MRARRENPEWVDQALKANWREIQATAEEHDLPMPSSHGGGRFEELGCGHYGCVLPTSNERIVFKLTTDPSESELVTDILGKFPPGMVKYYAILYLAGHKPIYGIWREAAEGIGELANEDKGLTKLLAWMMNSVAFTRITRYGGATMAEWVDAWNEIGSPILPDALVNITRAPWDESRSPTPDGSPTLSIMASSLAESLAVYIRVGNKIKSYPTGRLIGEALLELLYKYSYIITDLHDDNVGQVHRRGNLVWVITDPGRAIKIPVEVKP